MKYSTPLVLLLAVWTGALLLPTEGAAQIVFTESDLDAFIGQRMEATLYETEEAELTAEMQAIVDATGEDATYDFSTIHFADTLTGALTYYTMPADVPGADDPFFSTADFVVEMSFGAADADTTVWSFSQMQDDGLYAMGGVFPLGMDMNGDGAPDTLTMRNDPPSLSQPLPTTYGDSWTSTTFGGETETEVVGYGTLIGPDGQEMEALRMHRVTNPGGAFESTSVEFVTKEGVSASFSTFMGYVEGLSYTQITGTTGTAADPGQQEVARRLQLGQNYPNPFQGATTVEYSLPQATSVRLTVSDVLGRQVDVLVDQRQAAGRHQVALDASEWPAGMYLYRLEADGRIETRSMLVVK